MKTNIGRYLIAGIWLLAGLGKFFAVVAELISQRALVSPIIGSLTQETNWEFYRQICDSYYIPYALFFIFMAAVIEVISSLFILKGKIFARLGFLGVSFVLITYLPFHHGGALVGEMILLLAQLIFIRVKSEEDLLQGIIKKLKKSR